MLELEVPSNRSSCGHQRDRDGGGRGRKDGSEGQWYLGLLSRRKGDRAARPLRDVGLAGTSPGEPPQGPRGQMTRDDFFLHMGKSERCGQAART